MSQFENIEQKTVSLARLLESKGKILTDDNLAFVKNLAFDN